MRMLNRNKQKMWYSLQNGSTDVYETDDNGDIKYITVDGEDIPVSTGEKEPLYTTPISFKANINSTLTDTSIRAFGVADSSDKSIIVCGKDKIPLKIGARIWRKSEIKYKDEAKTKPDYESADYEVVAVNDESLNEDMFLLKKVLREG